MPPTSKEIQSRDSLNLMSERVANCAARLRYIANQMESAGLEQFEVKRYVSWRDGMPMVERFTESVSEAFYESLETLGKYSAPDSAPDS